MFLRQLVKTSSLLMGRCGFRYCHAIIVRELPKSFGQDAIRMDTSQQISSLRARQQWENYRETLKRCGLKVITLPADEKNPDCVFVEDAAVVVGKKACLARPGHPIRKNEAEAVRECLQTLGLETQELDDPTATVDGGDVLYTGQEIFVGHSTRTNKAGIDNLRRMFSGIPVTSIPIKRSLHLRSVATLGQEGLIFVGGTGDAPSILKSLQEEAKGQYRVVHLDKEVAGNVLFVNGQVIIKTEKELGSDFKKLTSSLTIPWIDIEFDELYKADGCLTCCSIYVPDPQDLC